MHNISTNAERTTQINYMGQLFLSFCLVTYLYTHLLNAKLNFLFN